MISRKVLIKYVLISILEVRLESGMRRFRYNFVTTFLLTKIFFTLLFTETQNYGKIQFWKSRQKFSF